MTYRHWLNAAQKKATAVLLVLGTAGLASAQTPEPTQQTMRKVYASLTALMPATTSPSSWQKSAKTREVQDALATLALAADELSRHGDPSDVSFRFLGQSLGQDARAIQRRVAAGRYESAAYLTQRMTETCVACHTRLPGEARPDFAQKLLARVETSHPSAFARARLQAATRQFDAALATYEQQFADPGASATLLESTDLLSSYLIVALRVRRDPERAQRGLAALGQRPDLSERMEQNLQIWRAAIRDHAAALVDPPTLDVGRRILEEGRRLSDFPADGADLAHGVIASSVLYRYIDETHPQGTALAEALYALARTEAFTRRSFELSEAEYYLEQAIRGAPHTAVAVRAYAVLERETRAGYTGSGGLQLPPDVSARLAELRSLSRTGSGTPGAREPDR